VTTFFLGHRRNLQQIPNSEPKILTTFFSHYMVFPSSHFPVSPRGQRGRRSPPYPTTKQKNFPLRGGGRSPERPPKYATGCYPNVSAHDCPVSSTFIDCSLLVFSYRTSAIRGALYCHAGTCQALGVARNITYLLLNFSSNYYRLPFRFF
jgi:hypothetical protein